MRRFIVFVIAIATALGADTLLSPGGHAAASGAAAETASVAASPPASASPVRQGPPSPSPQPAFPAAAAPEPAASAAASAAMASGGVAAGLLECRGAFAAAYGFGSRREVKCEYRAVAGANHYYTGTLERVGLDLGVSDQGSMLWAVVASTPDLAPGALAGRYVGISSGLSLGPGFSANILASQDAGRQITLQPLSVSSDSGISISLAGAALTLEPSAPRPQ